MIFVTELWRDVVQSYKDAKRDEVQSYEDMSY